jgi:catechol 2,3-dioxygenase-like lactoylglutathione lyase family enzyme
MTPAFSIGEINVICTSVEDSLKFYRDLLGFSVIGQEQDCYHLESNGRKLLLLPVAAQPTLPAPYCSVPVISVDLMVPDIEAAFRHLKDNGADFEREWAPGDRSFHIRDPDGLVWEVIAAPAG